jgi:hypothetical protein
MKLEELVRSVKGATGATLLGPKGVPTVHVGKSERERDAVLVRECAGQVVAMGQHLKLGPLVAWTLGYKDRSALVTRVETETLVLTAPPTSRPEVVLSALVDKVAGG